MNGTRFTVTGHYEGKDDPRGARRKVPPIIDSVLRAGEGRILRKLKRISEQINSIEEEFVAMSDADLRGLTDEFRQRYADGETLDDLLPEAFATAREAAKRTLGQRAFDVQLMGAAALHLGNIAEMRTGEGKTLTGVFPAYLHAAARPSRARAGTPSSPRSRPGCAAARTARATTRSTRRRRPSASWNPASRRSRTGSASTTSTTRSTRPWSAS